MCYKNQRFVAGIHSLPNINDMWDRMVAYFFIFSLCIYRFNYVRLSCILEKVHAMLILLFHQCYSSKNGKDWSESFGTTFHNQDKFSDRYLLKQKKCVMNGQVENWDISLLCDILLNSSYFFLVDPSLQLEVQCEFKGCKTKDCKNNQHGSNTLKFKSREDSAKLSGLTALLRVGSKRPQRITFDHAPDVGIVVKEKLKPNEYTIYPCSKKWVVVDQLRDIRNDYAHMNIYKISEQDLMDKAGKVKKAYEAFDKETSEIDAIMSGTATFYNDLLIDKFLSNYLKFKYTLHAWHTYTLSRFVLLSREVWVSLHAVFRCPSF